MQLTLGPQYNVGEKPTVILYIYINRHVGTPEKHWYTEKEAITSTPPTKKVYAFIFFFTPERKYHWPAPKRGIVCMYVCM